MPAVLQTVGDQLCTIFFFGITLQWNISLSF